MTKTGKYLEDLRSKSQAELNEELVAAKKELFNLRFQLATGQLQDTTAIAKTKRDIARAKTALRSLELKAGA